MMKNKLRTVAGNHYGHFCLGLLFCFFLVYYQFLYLGFVDDLVYSTAAQASFSDFLHFMRYHYNYANGRTWVHVLLIAFLRFGVYPWRVFMPVCFAASVYLIARLVSPSAQSLQKTLVWTCAAFLCVNIGLYKDTLFWMTGSFNYILPVPFICLLLLSLRSGRHLWCTPILGLLCGASTEQYGMITFGCLLLWLGYREFRLKEHAHRVWFIVSVLTTLAGVLTLVLSPSVRARTYARTGTLAGRISYLFFNFWFHSGMMGVFLALLAAAACLYLYSAASKRLWKAAALLTAAGIAALEAVSFLPLGTISALSVYGFAAAFLFAVFFAAAAAFRAGNGIPLLALLLGGGAQVMMLVTDRMAERTTMASVFCFAVFAVSLLAHADFSKKLLRIAAVLCVCLFAAYSAAGYVSYAAAQRAAFAAGECVAKHDIPHQSREDIDKLIEMCEEVRLEQVEAHLQAAKP